MLPSRCLPDFHPDQERVLRERSALAEQLRDLLAWAARRLLSRSGAVEICSHPRPRAYLGHGVAVGTCRDACCATRTVAAMISKNKAGNRSSTRSRPRRFSRPRRRRSLTACLTLLQPSAAHEEILPVLPNADQDRREPVHSKRWRSLPHG